MIRNIILKRDAMVRRLVAQSPVLGGSVVEGAWKCKVPGCRCKKKDIWHSAYTVTWKEAKKTRTLYIPIDLREEVKKWNEEYKRIKGLMDKISELNRIIIRSYVKRARGRRENA